MAYPTVYHNACHALIHDTADVRLRVARAIRYARKHLGRKVAKDWAYHFSFVGWPIKKRANGQYA